MVIPGRKKIEKKNQQPVKSDHSDPDKIVQVSKRGPTAGSSGVHSSSVALEKKKS